MSVRRVYDAVTDDSSSAREDLMLEELQAARGGMFWAPPAGGALLGGVLGFALGGPTGALIGVKAGAIKGWLIGKLL